MKNLRVLILNKLIQTCESRMHAKIPSVPPAEIVWLLAVCAVNEISVARPKSMAAVTAT